MPIVLLVAFALAAATRVPSADVDLVAELHTSHGALVVGFHPEDAPEHVAAFVQRARDGDYDGTAIHRIVPGVLVQGGSPDGQGDGGPEQRLDAEFNERPHLRGTLSMSRLALPDSAGSQFFFCLAPVPEYDGKYTVFGRVLTGEETLDALAEAGDESGIPTETVTLERIVVRERTDDDQHGN